MLVLYCVAEAANKMITHYSVPLMCDAILFLFLAYSYYGLVYSLVLIIAALCPYTFPESFYASLQFLTLEYIILLFIWNYLLYYTMLFHTILSCAMNHM